MLEIQFYLVKGISLIVNDTHTKIVFYPDRKNIIFFSIISLYKNTSVKNNSTNLLPIPFFYPVFTYQLIENTHLFSVCFTKNPLLLFSRRTYCWTIICRKVYNFFNELIHLRSSKSPQYRIKVNLYFLPLLLQFHFYNKKCDDKLYK